MKCQSLNNTTLVCMAACTVRLDCGHACTRLCHVNKDPDHLEFKCKKQCERECVNGNWEFTHFLGVYQSIIDCTETKFLLTRAFLLLLGHTCATKHNCSLKCPPCLVKMEKTLPCIVHSKVLECRIEPGSILCEAPCALKVPGCGHQCNKKCFEPCQPCQVGFDTYSQISNHKLI